MVAERQILALVLASVRSFTGWYDTSAITDWTRRLVSLVEPVQRVLARSTDSYLARSTTLLTGRSVRPVGAVDVSALRTGVTHEGAYGRVADTYRYQAAKIKQLEQTALVSPEQAAVNRARTVAQTDVRQASQHQSQKFMERTPKITGYRRVIHPEVSAGGTCGLCIAASDRLYKPQELMPIHDKCNCLPLPVYDDNDPGSALNAGDLSRLYDDAGKSYGQDLKRTRYKITEHGELGPLLNPKAADVRTAADAKRDERS